MGPDATVGVGDARAVLVKVDSRSPKHNEAPVVRNIVSNLVIFLLNWKRVEVRLMWEVGIMFCGKPDVDEQDIIPNQLHQRPEVFISHRSSPLDRIFTAIRIAPRRTSLMYAQPQILRFSAIYPGGSQEFKSYVESTHSPDQFLCSG